MATRLGLAVVILVVLAALLQTTVAQKTHVVGDNLGWLVPPGGPVAYTTWAAMQTFTVGDILVFNFTTGNQDVARVLTKEAFDTCNSTSPMWLETTGPANFTLSSVGEYYFICTMDRHCPLGQKLAINVTGSSGPAPPPVPAPPRAPVTYVVGDKLGWLVPPGGAIAYATWASNKTFIVGDTLVFDFVNGTQDVAVVTKSAYKTCDTNNTITVLTNSPAKITLTTTGEHYFTCTYPRHCTLGQQLAINVTASSTATPPSSSTTPPTGTTTASSPANAPTAGGPISPPASSAPFRGVVGFYVTFLSIVVAFLFN
ncbi:hypothetical protein F0562_009428 [Nyssa sinensis]|uniref:Phytocyanin domain-containing protein n=1 Tax=Nyssa sinensis TaxID=561372 RepID=A0A5J4ZW40_9ASTE|nr:hypothetical protein F0562_009428 [Nyssa sinensis]